MALHREHAFDFWQVDPVALREVLDTARMSRWGDLSGVLSPEQQDSDVFGAAVARLSDELIAWLEKTRPRSLDGELTRGKRLREGRLVTLSARVRFRWPDGKFPRFTSRISHVDPAITITGTFEPRHVISTFGRDALSDGCRQVFVLGRVTAVSSTQVRLAPMLIADMYVDRGGQVIRWMGPELELQSFPALRLAQHGAASRSGARRSPGASAAPSVERVVQDAMSSSRSRRGRAGPGSTVVTGRVEFRGARVAAMAVLSAGPSGAPLTAIPPRLLRLLDEDPAEILIVQHGHIVSPRVRAAMTALASQPGRLRGTVLLDGRRSRQLLRT